jgi:hypothetical protein
MNNEDHILPEELIHQAVRNMGFENFEAYKEALAKLPPASEADLLLCEDWSDDELPVRENCAGN